MSRSFVVEVSAELLADLAEWSVPVQVMVEEDSAEKGGYRMTFRLAQPSPGAADPGTEGC